MQLSKEQLEIINAENEKLFVLAKAGTGKTTTLREYTRQRPFLSFLYLAFNKEIKLEAKRKFFGNTEVHNIHSLAFKHFGKLYAHKLTENLNIFDIISGLEELSENGNDEVYSIANTVLSILTTYFSSKEIDLEKISNSEYLPLAEKYWTKMQSFKETKVKMTHDGYLKLFQISKPQLNYDYILVDEAQDSNEVMLDIVMSQNCNKIFVGDEHQQIYSFRGSQNIFSSFEFNIENIERLTLSKSFRFGEEIAKVANKLLSYYKKENILLKGNEKQYSEIGKVDKTIQHTIISRTNANIFDRAVFLSQQNKKIHIIGGMNTFNQLLDIYYLYIGRKNLIKSEFLTKFQNYIQFKSFSERVKHLEFVFLVKAIERYGKGLKEHFKAIERSLVGEKNAEVILTTAHKSKGLEFYNVILDNDFVNLYDSFDNLIEIEKIDLEEINLLYVAVTRAIEYLELNKDLEKLLY